MSWLQGFIGNMIAAEQLNELRELNEARASSPKRVHFDWDNPELISGYNKAVDEFKKKHSHLDTSPGMLGRYFPDKDRAVESIYNMACEGRLSEVEYLALFRQILGLESGGKVGTIKPAKVKLV